MKNFPAAVALHREALAIRRTIFLPDDVSIAGSLMGLGWALLEGGDPAAAEPLLRESLRHRRAQPQRDVTSIGYVESALGVCLTRLSRFAEAEPLLLRSYEAFEESLGREHGNTKTMLRRVIQLYEAWPRPDSAAEFRAKLPPNAP